MPMLATTKSAEASAQSPRPTRARPAVGRAPSARKIASSRFFAPSESAAAPSSGESTATTARAMKLAAACRDIAAPFAAPAAA